MTRPGTRACTTAVVVLALVGTGACGSDEPRDAGAAAPSSVDDDSMDAALEGELLVSAAASLTDAFSELADAFTAVHPDVAVVLNLGGSQALREQLLEGAPADVFASANPATMDQVVDAGLAAEPVVFAHNRMQIAVPSGNPGAVSGLADFADEDLLIGLCAPAVPCGEFAREVLRQAGVVAAVDTNEPDVRALLTKVELAELDAGITYATDVASTHGAVEGLDLPADVDVEADYPVVALDDAPNADAAAAFVAFLLDDRGRDILADSGFVTP